MITKKKILFSALIAGAVLAVSPVQARYENDVRLGTLLDSAIPHFVYPADYGQDTSDAPDIEDEVRIYFEQGYHPVTVLFYAMRNGMGADEVIDIAEDAGLVREHIDSARQAVEPVLPGGICGTSYFVKDPTGVPGAYSLTSLRDELRERADDGAAGDDDPVLTDVLNQYFDDNDVISVVQDNPNLKQIYNPNWVKTADYIAGGVPATVDEFLASDIPAHIYATADELLALADATGEYWYFQDSPLGQGQINSESLSATAPIMVALYADSDMAVINPWQMDRVNQAKADGSVLPVMFFYNGPNVRPLSQISKKIGFAELANAYIRYGIKVTPVPSWEHGNYHTQATAQQLKDLFDLPNQNDIPEERYTKALSTIDDGKPLQIAFVGGKMFLGDPDRAVAMISDGGYDFVPVHVSYVDLEPSESNFSVCQNAFPFAAGIAAPVPSGGVLLPPEPPIVPEEPCTDVTTTVFEDRVEVVPGVGSLPPTTRTVRVPVQTTNCVFL